MFRNILLITRREYLTQVYKKQFLILTVLAPILLIALSSFVFFLVRANETRKTIQVADASGLFVKSLKSGPELEFLPVGQAGLSSAKKELQQSETVDGLLVIPALENGNYDALEKNTVLLLNDNIDFDTKEKISSALSDVVRSERARQLHVSPDQLAALSRDFDLKSTVLSDNKEKDSDLDFGVKSTLGMFLMYVVFMFILMYGVRVMRSVLEEKNNRVVEVIISSVKPFELMLGKIIGVTLVALTQFLVWICMTVAAAAVFGGSAGLMKSTTEMAGSSAGTVAKVEQTVSQISATLLEMNYPLVIFVFLFYFLFGYLFFSSMYAAIGSAVDNETETQQFSIFAIAPLMLAMYGSFGIVQNPEGPLGIWLSLLPFTSPVAMVARIPFGVPLWQLILSMLILVLSAIFMVFLAGKIYRIGILTYGNKASLKEIWKWLRE